MSSKFPKFENPDSPAEACEECVLPHRRKFGFDYAINPIYIGAFATLLLALLAWGGGPSGVNSHLAAHDIDIAQGKRDIEALRESDRTIRQDTREDLKIINEKLDRLIERRR